MTNDLLLKNGLVVTPSGAIRGGLAITGERIVGVGTEEALGSARREIDLKGKASANAAFGLSSIRCSRSSRADRYVRIIKLTSLSANGPPRTRP